MEEKDKEDRKVEKGRTSNTMSTLLPYANRKIHVARFYSMKMQVFICFFFFFCFCFKIDCAVPGWYSQLSMTLGFHAGS